MAWCPKAESPNLMGWSARPKAKRKQSTNLMACLGDASNCDDSGNCGEDCGYVNGTFMCFASCTGADCSGDTFPDTGSTGTCDENNVCTEDGDGTGTDTGTDTGTGTGTDSGSGDGSGTGSSGGGSTDVDMSGVIEQLQNLNDKFDISTSREDGEVELGALDTIFDQDSIDELKGQTEEIQTDIKDFFASTKTELASMFSFSGGGGSYQDFTFAFTYGTYTSKIWEYFSANVGIIAAVIMFLAYLMAARIVLE